MVTASSLADALLVLLLVSVSCTHTAAFAPQVSFAKLSTTGNSKSVVAARQIPFTALFAVDDDEVEAAVAAEMNKNKKISNLRNAKGVEYAPWMKISVEDEKQIRQMVKEKAVARAKRQDQEKNVQGALLKDSQAQELSGGGLRYKIIDGSDVELEWATAKEASTLGFIVKRRAAKTDDFEVLASYETFGPLASQGKEGGVYRYLDPDMAPGGYVYRITEREKNGNENDLSQCLVDIKTAEEQRGALIAVAGFAVIAIAAVVAGSLLDPVQY
jgi:hypothetical protein